MTAETVTVVVSVGTDHHPFDRLVTWVENWVAGARQPVELIVQHGSSRPAIGAQNFPMVDRQELLTRFGSADILVTQVGPGTILDANSVGRRPIVVARDPELGEHIDTHQQTFGAFMAGRDAAVLARTEAELHAAMDAALTNPSRYRIAPRTSPAPTTARELALVVDDVMQRSAGFLSLAGVLRMVRTPRRTVTR